RARVGERLRQRRSHDVGHGRAPDDGGEIGRRILHIGAHWPAGRMNDGDAVALRRQLHGLTWPGIALEQKRSLVDARGQPARAQRRRNRARVLVLASEQAGDTGGLRSYLEAQRAEVSAPVDGKGGDLAALSAFAVDDRQAIAGEYLDDDGAAAA